MMRNVYLLLLTVVLFGGCDAIYKYVFLPPQRLEYTLLPDKEMVSSLKDSNYYVSPDGQTLVFNAKSWKMEIKFMSDYQLNTFEFPDESKQAEFSGNPFTYGNWIDPAIGYTPRRFTVLKVSIFNYTNSKINFDPEQARLATDRGDNFAAYAREKKNARNLSIEEYFTKRKGKSGVEDDIFETRMGIARRTMLYFGKPIYKGDNREGLVVFDPMEESVRQLKISVKNFITAYDENNEPSEFKDLTFYLSQQPLSEEAVSDRAARALAGEDTTIIRCSIAQLKYNTRTDRLTYEQPYNPLPRSVPNLISYVQANSKIHAKYLIGTLEEEEILKAPIVFLMGSGLTPEFSPDFMNALAKYLDGGGFIFMDNSFFKTIYPFNQFMEELLVSVQRKLTQKSEIKNISLDHPVFRGLKKFDKLPPGYDDQLMNFDKAAALKGLFIGNRLAALISPKGYSVLWAGEAQNTESGPQFDFGLNVIHYSVTSKNGKNR
jgi:hypothetical protein